MQAPKTPGVYIEEISKFPPSVAAVETAIPAFVGYTEMAVDRGTNVTNQAVPIKSRLDFERIFGGPQNETVIAATITQTGDTIEVTAGLSAAPSIHILYYSLQVFFANGGGKCYIVSVGTFGAVDLAELTAGVAALERVDEPTLILFPEAQSLAQGDHFSLINAALDQCVKLQDRFVIADLNVGAANATLDERVAAFRNGVTSGGVKYGAAYAPSLRTSFDYAFTDAGVNVTHTVDGVAGALNGPLEPLKNTENALYNQIIGAIRQIPIVLPPSGAMAGVYTKVDSNRGVWKAPANVGLNNVLELTEKITQEDQESLNVDPTSGKSINAIRAFTGRGILVWGARTLDGNSNEWRYVSVRRFFNMVEESTKKASARFVFEPNDKNTWVKVRAMIENFLLLQWRAGALQGAKPEQAFYVKVGLGETMTAIDVLEGRMNVEIGLAVVRPAEFIILKFSHKLPEA